MAQVSSAQLATLARIAAGSPPKPDGTVDSAPPGDELTMDDYRCVPRFHLPPPPLPPQPPSPLLRSAQACSAPPQRTPHQLLIPATLTAPDENIRGGTQPHSIDVNQPSLRQPTNQ